MLLFTAGILFLDRSDNCWKLRSKTRTKSSKKHLGKDDLTHHTQIKQKRKRKGNTVVFFTAMV